VVQATGVILAGGKSTRMGRDKAFLDIGREKMIRRVAGELGKVFKEILICGGTEEISAQLGFKVVADMIKGGGPLSGIHAALHHMSYQRCLVAACDMPFINAAMAQYLVRQAEGYDVAVPRHGVHLQPLFAVYNRDCLPAVERSLTALKYKITDFYALVRVNYVHEEKLRALADVDFTFFNVNTLVDLEKAREMARKKDRESKTC